MIWPDYHASSAGRPVVHNAFSALPFPRRRALSPIWGQKTHRPGAGLLHRSPRNNATPTTGGAGVIISEPGVPGGQGGGPSSAVAAWVLLQTWPSLSCNPRILWPWLHFILSRGSHMLPLSLPRALRIDRRVSSAALGMETCRTYRSRNAGSRVSREPRCQRGLILHV